MPEIERALREKARKKLHDTTLPLVKPSRTWGGPGAGEFELQFVREAEPPDIFHFHLACFGAWELERGLLVRTSAIR